MHRANWDDLRFVIAVAETGSVSQAARRLGVNHATVLRRVSDFEQRHGTAIFEKTTRGYRVLTDKRDVIQAAKVAETAMTTVGQLAGGHNGELRGKTRVTSTDTFCQMVLPTIVADLQNRAEGLFIELISSNAHVDLALHQIDVAVRPTIELAADLEGESIATLGLAVYTSNRVSKAWLGLSGPLARSEGARWMADNVDPDQIVAASDSFFVLRDLAAVGCGQAILPCLIGDGDPRLLRAATRAPHFKVPLWVASHVNHAASARSRSLRAAFSQALFEKSDALLGE
jgi:DNA-binding transcriptional LysR family regulator